MKPEDLIRRYFMGEASEEEVADLDALLAADAGLRRRFVFEAGNDTALREIALERISEPKVSDEKVVRPAFRSGGWMAAAAAVILLGGLTWTQFSSPKVIATLVSSEDASWESALPTAPGSDLVAGYLKLNSGIATIRFRSGAEVLLEAPADFVLETPMKGRLLRGAAVIDVPESAIGFVMETPDGYAVDHGTRFAVSVGEENEGTDFEVLDGEISVFHPKTESEVRLSGKQATTITSSGLEKRDGPIPEATLERDDHIIRVGTQGMSVSVIANNDEDYLHPDFLMAKKSVGKIDFDRRSVFSFSLDGIDIEKIESARIRLNLVPSGIGFAGHLPKVNRFSIYGLGGESPAFWDSGILWENVPLPESGKLLGSFEIPRSQQRAAVGINSDELLRFIQEHPGTTLTFLLVRETSETESRGLVHTFASDSHPEASGPTLELFTNKTQ